MVVRLVLLLFRKVSKEKYHIQRDRYVIFIKFVR
ncbi:hypothetical protein SAMN04488541_102042 [Thermoflexibacter ruber]|uniref:Uncharacterized protein n=1 Tax=Thermoflexibacter ruber TaxID=1003 RepID=A0A1I2GVU1_9BACT|nr:hypothetical protein SAMN04488541_102042 [Thermoflexibacter ruber]